MRNDRLYDLLPEVYRWRDAEHGEVLRALLRVIGEQVDVVESDIAQLYDNPNLPWIPKKSQPYFKSAIDDVNALFQELESLGEHAKSVFDVYAAVLTITGFRPIARAAVSASRTAIIALPQALSARR